MEISVIAITEANGTKCLCTYKTQLMDGYFAGVRKWNLVCVSLMASHLTYGETNHYSTYLCHQLLTG